MRKNDIFIIVSAPSGCGKTTIIERLMARDNSYDFVVSTTSREKRKGETGGKNYYFVSPEEFRDLIGRNELIEWSIVHENYYGITKKEFDRIKSDGRIPIFDVDVQGAVKLKDKLENAVFVFIIPPSFEVLRERLIARKTDSKKSIEVRLENARNELKQINLFDYVIVNDVVDKAVDDLSAIIRAELCRDKSAADKLLENLED
jgi:guanylate kinase